MKNQLYRSKDH